MLSVVPLIDGGGLFETGAGGRRPKHVQQLLARRTTCAGTAWASSSPWPSASSTWPSATGNPGHRSWPTPSIGRPAPSSTRTARRVGALGGIDNRGSHFYLALYWAQELAAQTDDPSWPRPSPSWPERLSESEAAIVGELLRRPGVAGRHRRVLQARPDACRSRHAPIADLQRRARGPSADGRAQRCPAAWTGLR